VQLHEVVGEFTGTRWYWQFQRDRINANGERYRAAADAGRPVLVHVVRKEPLWSSDPDIRLLDEADLSRARRAIEVARCAEVADAAELRHLVDTAEDEYALKVIWEWAEMALHEHLRDAGADCDLAEAVGVAVGSGLNALQAAGWVHCDVAPNNVLRVDGRWKLADFDNSVRIGEPVQALTRLTRYVPEGAQIGMRAEPTLDEEALGLLVTRLRQLAQQGS
jgi:hypothetical protein